jgi:hypothetical protein
MIDERILALDPGVTTGWSYYNGTRVLQSGQFKGSHLKFEGHLSEWASETIVYERFQYQRRDKVVLYPVEVIGVIKLYAEKWGVSLFEQTPSQAKNLWTDDKLKTLGLWIPGKPHAMDATRHLLYHLVVTKGDREWLEPLRPKGHSSE